MLQKNPNHDTIQSPMLRNLAGRLLGQDQSALPDFWSAVSTMGTPLVELESPGKDAALVTFLFRASTDVRVSIGTGVASASVFEGNFKRLGATDVLFHTVRLPVGTSTVYKLAVDDSREPLSIENWPARMATWKCDSLNPNRFRLPANPVWNTETRDEWSILSIPAACDPKIESSPALDVLRIPHIRVRSAHLENERTVWVDLPSSAPQHAVIYLDGFWFTSVLEASSATTLLTRNGELPPVASFFVDSVSYSHRFSEMAGKESFAQFICDELIPLLSKSYDLPRDPSFWTICGVSLGGLAALHTALTRSNAPANVIAHSGSFWFKDSEQGEEIILEAIRGAGRQLGRIFIDVGSLESHRFAKGCVSMLEAVTKTADILRARGYDAHLEIFAGGHDFITWKKQLPGALKCVIGNYGQSFDGRVLRLPSRPSITHRVDGRQVDDSD